MEIQINGNIIRFGEGCNFVPIKNLVFYDRNPKNHTDKDVDLIIRSIKRNGWGDPILVCPETMEVLSGNGRLMAAQKLGMKQVPVVYAPKGLSNAQKANLVIASNKLVEVSGYNDYLGELIDEFRLDLDDFGIEEDESMVEEMPKLKDGDKSPFQQMTFTLADGQAEVLNAAIAKAKQSENYGKDTMGNKNTNGNALYVIAMEWLNG